MTELQRLQHRYLEEFFAAGRDQVDEVFAVLAERGVSIGTARALDFGCGLGRLTRALAEHFDVCDGVDTAARLIEHARALGEDGDRVRFSHTTSRDLRLFGDASFDFILALTGLRHVEPELMPSHMREFLRVLRPGGAAFFNLPDQFVAAQELPREGWQATLAVIGSIPALAPGEVFPLELEVRNDSPVPWPASAHLRVGQRGRTHGDGVVAIDDTGALIQAAVNSGGDHQAQLWVVAPLQPGEYELEVDLLQEQSGWFADRGSRSLKVPVAVAADVVEAAAPAVAADVAGIAATAAATTGRRIVQGEQAAPGPTTERHAMAREDVVAMVQDAGGMVLEMFAKDRSGPSMRSLDYVIARAVAPAPTRPRGEQHDQQPAIEARIRRALKYAAGSSPLSGRLLAADPQRSQRRRVALQLIDERADLVGFRLSSRLKGVGRVSTLVREGLRRALFQVLYRQTEFNRSSGELIRGHEAQLEALGATVRAQLDIQAGSDERLDALEHRLARAEVNSVGLARRAAAGVREGLAGLEYLSFAERFHGTPQERRERLSRFVPRFEGRSEVIDAGCGRGEFLELLREAGVSAVGVDSDEAMVGRCREFGLDAIQADIVQFLRGRPEQSHGGIFAAQLLEHLERGEIVELVRLAFSKLRPGGVLVLETVDPLCLLTYASFYGDLTHVAPVPPLALQWLAESCGFASVAIEHLSPVAAEEKLRPLPASAGGEAEVEAFNRGVAAANEVLFGFQEYALTAHKPG